MFILLRFHSPCWICGSIICINFGTFLVITSSVSSSVFHSLLCFWELQFHILLDITNEVIKDLFLFLLSIIFLFVLKFGVLSFCPSVCSSFLLHFVVCS